MTLGHLFYVSQNIAGRVAIMVILSHKKNIVAFYLIKNIGWFFAQVSGSPFLKQLGISIISINLYLYFLQGQLPKDCNKLSHCIIMLLQLAGFMLCYSHNHFKLFIMYISLYYFSNGYNFTKNESYRIGCSQTCLCIL